EGAPQLLAQREKTPVIERQEAARPIRPLREQFAQAQLELVVDRELPLRLQPGVLVLPDTQAQVTKAALADHGERLPFRPFEQHVVAQPAQLAQELETTRELRDAIVAAVALAFAQRRAGRQDLLETAPLVFEIARPA